MPPKKRGSGKASRGDGSNGIEMDDELDTFQKSRDKILLESEEEEEETDEEGVFDLDASESEEEDDEEEEEEEEEGEEGEEGEGGTAWGTKKGAFYGADYIDEELGEDYHSDMEDAELEEQELARLRKKQTEVLDESDFVSAESTLFQKSKEAPKEVEEVVESDDEIERELIERDVSKLTDEQKLELIVKDSPELLGLLEEFKEQMVYVKAWLMPAITRAKAQGAKGSGLEYLETKMQLVLRYCLNVSFYMALRAEGPVAKDHPVISQLVETKGLMSKMEPLDALLSSEMQTLALTHRIENASDESDLEVESEDFEEETSESEDEDEEEEDDNEEMEEEEENDEVVEAIKPTLSIKPSKLQYEEAAFKKGKAKKEMVGNQDIVTENDFGEVEVEEEEGQKKRKKSVWTKTAPKTKKDHASAETDVPRKDRERRDTVHYADEDEDYQDIAEQGVAKPAGMDAEQENDYYHQVAESRKKRKVERDALHAKKADYLPEEEAEAKRGINWQIEKNKGLTARRGKTNNPRVKHK
eukprot:Ihof_evm5s93 gene=Ihof_evmTU5s93